MLKIYCRPALANMTARLLMMLSLVAALTQTASAEVDWKRLLNGDHRSVENQQRDRYRNPVKTLSFFGVEPCDTVVELWPGPLGW